MLNSKAIEILTPLFEIIKNAKGKTIRELKIELSIERENMKKGECMKCEIVKAYDVVSPFFLPPCSVFINVCGQQWQWGEHRSVGCDIIDCAFTPKMAIYLKKS